MEKVKAAQLLTVKDRNFDINKELKLKDWSKARKKSKLIIF